MPVFREDRREEKCNILSLCVCACEESEAIGDKLSLE